MFWFTLVLCSYLAYYSIRYARLIWKDKNKLGALMVCLVAGLLGIMPFIDFWLFQDK
ncbi:hypothetical protein [Bacillus salacetis]|uniref:hypothetical protein n=1 Tax=Bacillus salacetis TaxID=2315464 RepID=UPI001443B5A0|nr:hypothetical protein [Bacillus salacetis]